MYWVLGDLEKHIWSTSRVVYHLCCVIRDSKSMWFSILKQCSLWDWSDFYSTSVLFAIVWPWDGLWLLWWFWKVHVCIFSILPHATLALVHIGFFMVSLKRVTPIKRTSAIFYLLDGGLQFAGWYIWNQHLVIFLGSVKYCLLPITDV